MPKFLKKYMQDQFMTDVNQDLGFLVLLSQD